MKRIINVAAALLLMAVAGSSCHQAGKGNGAGNAGAQRDETVRAEWPDTAAPFLKAVSTIGLTPVQEDGDRLLGENVGLRLLDDGFVLFDRRNMRVYRYASDGRFLNEIGRRGNGPGEYSSLGNVQCIDGDIHIFSLPDKELVYSKEGVLLRQTDQIPVGFGAFRTDDGILTYYGYSGQRDCRLVLFPDGTEQEKRFLPVEAELLMLNLEKDIFFPAGDGGGINLIDAYSPTVYRFEAGEVAPRLTFDLGKYAIPEDFYRQGDVFKAAEYLLGRDHALLAGYLESPGRKLVQLMRNNGKTGGPARDEYGYYDGRKWIWFSLSEIGIVPLPGPFCCFDGEDLVGLFSREDLEKIRKEIPEKIADGSVLDEGPEADYYVAKINLQ